MHVTVYRTYIIYCTCPFNRYSALDIYILLHNKPPFMTNGKAFEDGKQTKVTNNNLRREQLDTRKFLHL